MEFTLNASNRTIRVPVSLIDDDIYELTETFTAGLNFTSDVPPRTTISPNNATITILDDESMFLNNYGDYLTPHGCKLTRGKKFIMGLKIMMIIIIEQA